MYAFNTDYTGQVMIEPVFSEIYNITMTSFPIIVYAIWDFQYEKVAPDADRKIAETGREKKYLMKNAELY